MQQLKMYAQLAPLLASSQQQMSIGELAQLAQMQEQQRLAQASQGNAGRALDIQEGYLGLAQENQPFQQDMALQGLGLNQQQFGETQRQFNLQFPLQQEEAMRLARQAQIEELLAPIKRDFYLSQINRYLTEAEKQQYYLDNFKAWQRGRQGNDGQPAVDPNDLMNFGQ